MSIYDFVARLAHTPVPWWMARGASWVLATYAIVTGIDYLNTSPEASQAKSLVMVVRLATLHTWGGWFVISGVVLLLGLITSGHVLVWLGHFLCAILYSGFAAASVQAVFEYQSSPAASRDGWIWRAAYLAVMVALAHWALCWLRGPVPRRGDEA